MRWPGPDVGSVVFPASDARSVSFPGADREIVAFPPAPMLVIPIDASVSGIGTVAATLVTTPVYPMDVTGLGTASAAVTASSVIPAGVTGEGEALAVFAQLIEAPVSGVGTASVVVKPSITLAAGVAGSGTASAMVIPAATIVAAASCEGIPGVDAWPAAIVSIAATGSGTASAGLTARTPINASASGEGTPVATVAAVTFKPQGMTLTTEFVFKTATPVVVAPMVAASATMPTSVVDTNALDMQNPGPVRVAWTAPISNYSGDKMDGAVYINGTLAGTAVRTDNPPFRRGAVFFGSVNATVAKNDKVALRVNGVSASFDQSVMAGARVNVYKQDQLSQIGSRSADYVVTSTTNVWFDLTPNATSPGAVLNGTALVAQFDHPDVLLGADIYMSSANPVNLRILKNGVQVASGTAGSNDGRVGALGSTPIAVGDLIQVQVARPNAGNWTVKTGSSWGIV